MDASEIQNSISKTLKERITSPFYGTLIISWIIWNWRIFYLTFFISESQLIVNKIDYIVSNFNNPCYLYWYPIISTVLLIVLFPFVSIGALWMSQWFDILRDKAKNHFHKQKTISYIKYLELESSKQELEDNIKELKVTLKNHASETEKQLKKQEDDIETITQRLNNEKALNTNLSNSVKYYFDNKKRIDDLFEDLIIDLDWNAKLNLQTRVSGYDKLLLEEMIKSGYFEKKDDANFVMTPTGELIKDLNYHSSKRKI